VGEVQPPQTTPHSSIACIQSRHTLLPPAFWQKHTMSTVNSVLSKAIYVGGSYVLARGFHLFLRGSMWMGFGDTEYLWLQMVNSISNLNNNSWHHVIFTWKGSAYVPGSVTGAWSWCVDGTYGQAPTGVTGNFPTYTPVQSSSALKIGNSNGSGTFVPYVGYLASIRLYSKALSQTEMEAIYAYET